MMAAALRLLHNAAARNEQPQRQLWLYDTFDGMTQPGSKDVDFLGQDAGTLLGIQDRFDPNSVWCYSRLDQVKQAIFSTLYPESLSHFVVGPVETTIPQQIPEQIAILRLDTDWYQSTKHELVHLIPRLCPGGVLIVDDYGHWAGCRQAVDEYLAENNITMFLNRVDYTCRLGIYQPETQSDKKAA